MEFAAFELGKTDAAEQSEFLRPQSATHRAAAVDSLVTYQQLPSVLAPGRRPRRTPSPLSRTVLPRTLRARIEALYADDLASEP